MGCKFWNSTILIMSIAVKVIFTIREITYCVISTKNPLGPMVIFLSTYVDFPSWNETLATTFF